MESPEQEHLLDISVTMFAACALIDMLTNVSIKLIKNTFDARMEVSVVMWFQHCTYTLFDNLFICCFVDDTINNCIVYNSKTIVVKSNHFWVGERMTEDRYATLCHISDTLR